MRRAVGPWCRWYLMTPESRPWFVLALSIGLGWLVYRLAPVITPFAISAGLAYLGDPLVDRLQRLRLVKWQVSRTVAVLSVFALMVAAFVAGLLIVLPLLRDQVLHLVERAPAMLEWLAGTAMPWLQARLGLTGFELDAQSIAEAAREYWKEAGSAVLGVLGSVSRGGETVLELAGQPVADSRRDLLPAARLGRPGGRRPRPVAEKKRGRNQRSIQRDR